MKLLEHRTCFQNPKNGKNFRFLGKENPDDTNNQEALLQYLLTSLSSNERLELILKLTQENQTRVKNVLEKIADKPTPKQAASQETKKQIEAILNQKESQQTTKTDPEAKKSAPTSETKTTETNQTNTTEHNQDRNHQDLDTQTDKPKKSVLEQKNEGITKDIIRFRKEVDGYVKRALPEKQPDLQAGINQLAQNYGLKKNILNQMEVFAEPIWSDLSPRIQAYESKISQFSNEYRELKDEDDPNIVFMKRKELSQSFEAHIESWQKLDQKIQQAKTQLIEVFQKTMGLEAGAMFAKDYFQDFDRYAGGLKHTLKEFKTLASEKNFDFDGQEIFWRTIPKRIQVLKRYLNFGPGGKLSKFSDETSELFESQPNGIKFLHRNQFFEEYGEQKFDKKFGESVNRVDTYQKKYQKKFNQVRSILEKDLNKLSEEDFREKYQSNKEPVYQYLAGQESQIKRFNNAVNEYGKRKFLPTWIRTYNHPSTRPEAIKNMTIWSEFDTTVTNAANPDNKEHRIINELELFIQNLNRPARPKYIYFSLYDASQLFTEYFEYRKRLWTRRSDQAVSKLGVKAFGSDDPRTNSQIAKEFVKKDEDSEDARVSEYKTQKGSLNLWDIRDDLYNTNNSDEAKACIDMLIDKGGIEWFDPNLWDVLNRLEGFNRFKPTDKVLDRGELNRKLRNAISNIWSEEYFNDWDKKIASSRNSAMESFVGEYDSYETDFSKPNPRTRILTEMVKKSYNGELEGVEPARYEGFLRRSIPMGKQNGGPRNDERVWYLVHGVASGVIGPEAFSRMNGDFLYDLPIVDFFTDKSSWKKDGKIVPAGTPGSEVRPWNYKDYLAWGEMLGSNNGTYLPDKGFYGTLSKFVYENIMNSASVHDRTQRGVRNAAKKWDHDDGAMYAPTLSANDVGMMLTANSNGTEQMTSDFWRNYLSEYKFVFHSALKQINENDALYGKMEGWQTKRQDMLIDIGNRMRSALTVTLVLSGNLGFTDGRPTAPFSEEKWTKNTAFSPSAEDSKKIIDDMAQIFLKNAQISDEERQKYETLVNYRAVKDGKSYKTAEIQVGNKKYKTQEEATKLVSGDDGMKIFSSDLSAIERSLREFCKNHPVGAGD